MSELPLNCRLPIDPTAAADPTAIGYASELAKAEMDKMLAETGRVIVGEVTETWAMTRQVEDELIELPWAPGEPTEGAVLVYLTARVNTVPA